MTAVTLSAVIAMPPLTGRPRVRSVRLVALLAGAVVLFTACGGDPPTAVGYFGELADELTGFSEAIAAQQEDYGKDLGDQLTELHDATDFGDLGAMSGFFDQAGELAIVKSADLFSTAGAELRGLMERLGRLEPPEELAVAHADLLTAGSGLVTAVPTATETVRNLDSIDQLEEALDGSEYATAAQRFAIACTNLADASATAGVTVELNCPQPLIVAPVP
ncbi:hypothetical protein BH24ACT7_BH24ACT7_06440 [soil metagenome]